jgi:hypothetical protein
MFVLVCKEGNKPGSNSYRGISYIQHSVHHYSLMGGITRDHQHRF